MITINTITTTLARKYNMTFSGRLINREIVIRTQGHMPHELLSIVVEVTGTDITNHMTDNISVPRRVWQKIIDRVNYLPPMPEVSEASNVDELMAQTIPVQATLPTVREATMDNLNTQSETPPVEAESQEETPTWECADCEETFEGTPDYELEGRNLCESCRDDYFTCEGCNDLFDQNNENYTSTDNYMYCESCADSCTYYCEGCDYTYDGDDYYSAGGSTYCSDCYHDRYVDCDECGDSYPSDDNYYCEDCGTDYCSNCWSEHEHNDDNLTPEQREERQRTREEAQRRALEESRLRNPFRKPSMEFYAGNPEAETRFIKVDRFVGIEIEAEKGDTYGLGIEVPEEVGISTDGSLHDRGVELQTPPASLDRLETFVEKTCEALQKKGYKGTRSAGLHVHIDARDIRNDHKKLTQVIKTFYSVEDMLYSMLPPSRWASNYCKRLSQDYLYSNFRTKADVKDVQKEWYKAPDASDSDLENHARQKYNSARYFGLNIHSVFHRGTIELRYHSGTVNPVKILQWANLCLRLMDWAVNNYDDKLVEKLFELETGQEKYRLFKGMLNMPYELETYVQKRMNKFNPNFVVKFNKGKKVRALERRKITQKKNKIEKMIFKCYEDKLARLKAYWATPEAISWGDTPPTNERLEQQARQEAESEVRFRLPEELRQLMPDGGFIEDSEIRTIQAFMQTGRQLHEANTQGGEVDIEE